MPRTTKLGMASLILAIGIFVVVLASIGLTWIASRQGGKTHVVFWTSSVLWLLAPGGHLIGLVLGTVDLFRPGSKKLIPALGVAGNALLGAAGVVLLFLALGLTLTAISTAH